MSAEAARKLLRCAAAIVDCTPDHLAAAVGAPALAATSTKRGLDIDWNDPEQKADAIKRLVAQIERLETWVLQKLREDAARPPLSEALATLAQLREQDLEPDPEGGGPRIRRGVAEDRRVSVQDPDMRHGRKTKSRTFNGYKSHLAADLDTGLILACGVTPANRHEADALPGILQDVSGYRDRNCIGEVHIDRGYLASENVRELAAARVPIIAKPWRARPSELFSKTLFRLDLARLTITCPAGNTEKIRLGTIAQFPAATCDACPMRAKCTDGALGRGRTVAIANDERLQKKLRSAIATPRGRARLRQRVKIEHRLAHHASKQGTRARYHGLRKNLFDARRHAATINLEQLQLREAA